ncbi:MBL fold metallo-hydrolase [Rubrivirga sp.]|uniref:MBL fold metallo-hydrolase n=1 Tax=Rubrivirga sp. TaxID=1885344 RepID=UPI003B515622
MLSRRQFVARSAVAAVALGVSPLATAAPRRRAEFTLIRRGVGAFTDRGGTIGYLRSPDVLVAVDTQFPESARTFLDGLRDGDRRLDVLVNTHHHGDHTAGNAVLAPVAERHVAHEAVPGLQRARAVGTDGYDAQHYADETFRETWRADLGDETLALSYLGPAHTCGDAVVHFERADVVHMGDLVFNRRQPFIDRAGGASVEGWGTVLETVHGRFSDETVFVFGHAGEGHPVIGDRADLLVMRDFLAAARLAIVPRAADGATAAEIEGLVIPGFEDWGPTPARVAEPMIEEFARS